MIALFFLLLASAPAEANNKVGNGGNVVECKAHKKTKAKASVRLLDFYEHEVTLETNEKDPLVIAGKALDQLQSAAPKLAEQYRLRLKEISDELDIKPGVKLTIVEDSLHLFQPSSPHCKVTQIAIRRHNPTGSEKRFLVSKDLWTKLSPADKAGLLMHEIIYEHFSKLGEWNSVKARKVNALLFSGKIESEKFWGLLKELRLPI